MNFWKKIIGSDMTKELKAFNSRAKQLPADYQEAWEKISLNLWPHSDFTGRNLMPILDGVLGLLEEAAADGQSVQEVKLASSTNVKSRTAIITSISPPLRRDGGYHKESRQL